MARRATVIEGIRKDHDHVLLLDCGDVFDPEKKTPELRAETIFHVMERMGYDAMNVADADLSFGMDFFNRLSEKSSIMTLSATIRRIDTRKHVYQPYLIKTFGKLRIAIVGVSSPLIFPDSMKTELAKNKVLVESEMMVLKQLLPEVRRRSDIVILLSHLGYSGTVNMLRSNEIEGIDVAVAGHGRKLEFAPAKVGNTIVVENSMQGEYLGKLVLIVGANGAIEDYDGELIGLGREVPDTQWAKKMMDEFDQKALAKRKEERKKEALSIDREKNAQLLKLSPREAILKLQERQKEQLKRKTE